MADQTSVGGAAVSWRAVVVPAEHGGWGLLLEPILLGLALAPSWAGLAIAAAALAAFLARQPVRLVAMDLRRGVRYPRTALALRCAAALSLLAVACLALAVPWARAGIWPAVLAALPFALPALAYDIRGRGRDVAPEVAGAVALGGSSTVIALAGGAAIGLAWSAWLLLALRAVSAVVYVRARIRLDRGLPAGPRLAVALHVVSFVAAALLAALALAPRVAALAFAVLAVRAARGVSPRRRVVRPQVLGLQELRYGALTLLLLALGYRLGL